MIQLQPWQAFILSKGTRRIIQRGFRVIAGVRIPCGSIIEEYDPQTKQWVYVTCVHPDDAPSIASKPSRFLKA